MLPDPILHLIGLAKKAGKLEIGEEPVGAVCRARHAKLLLLAGDAAPNSCRRAAHFGEAGNVLFLQLPFSKAELGLLLGRTSCAMLAVTDSGFAASLAEKLAALDPERYSPAAAQLRVKADRVLARQREKAKHEKNLRLGKSKPWAASPVLKPVADGSPPRAKPFQRSAKPKPPAAGTSAPYSKGGPSHPGHPSKSGPGGRRLSGKFRHNP